jgi:hypothetical protein
MPCQDCRISASVSVLAAASAATPSSATPSGARRQVSISSRSARVRSQNWQADDRRKILAFARDLLNSDYAGHRLAFAQFAQALHFNHLAAVYNSFDFSGPLDFVRRAADLSPRVMGIR